MLQGCFEATDWDSLCEPHGDDISAVTECVTDYISFCLDNTIPTRTVRCFPSYKPWTTSDLKELLNKKKGASREGDREIQSKKQLQVKIRDSKEV